jgi:sulfate adenylyltransferase
MESIRKNRDLYIDIEAIASLALVQEGLLYPVQSLMDSKTAKEVDDSGKYNGKTFPFSFILAPSGKKNNEVLSSAKVGEKLNLVNSQTKQKCGEIIIDEVFEIDRNKRVEKIYSTSNPSHPGVKDILQRLGNLAVCGEFFVEFDAVKNAKYEIQEATSRVNAKNIKAIMMAGKPLHRAHERMIRTSMENTDLVVIFLLKPYKQDKISYELREKTVKFFIKNYLPMNRVIVVPFENTYIFAGNNEVILNSIVAKNFGCTQIAMGKNHAGLGMYYDKSSIKSIFDTLVGVDISVDIVNEYVYCDECKTLVSTSTCPHGQHHHIHYHSKSILELFNQGLLPPTILVRKEISAIILSSMFPNRFKKLEELYYDILPMSGLLEQHSEEEFYVELMKLYQTTSLT